MPTIRVNRDILSAGLWELPRMASQHLHLPFGRKAGVFAASEK